MAEARINAGGRVATWTAAREVGGLASASLRAWARRLGEVGRGSSKPSASRVIPDLRLLLVLARRERGSTAALITIIVVVSSAMATFATLGQALRTGATSSANADRLAWIWADRSWEADGTPLVSDAHLGHLRDRSESFEGMAGIWMVSGRVRGGSRPVHADVARVSVNFFDLLDVKPHLGRLFVAGEDRPGAPWVAVLSHEMWKTNFGADPGVIGRRVVVGVPEMEVVGVLPEGFRFEQPDALGPYGEPAVWLPARHQFGGGYLPQDVQAILSLRRTDRDRQLAVGELDRLGREADAAIYANRGFAYRLQSLPAGRTPGLNRAVGLIGAALAGMLAVALTSVFLLALAREANRTVVLRALRLVGATKRRLAVVIGVEAVLYGVVGCVGGLAVTVAGLRAVGASQAFLEAFPIGSLWTWVTVGVVGASAALLALGHGGAGAFFAVRASARRAPLRVGGQRLRVDRGVILLQMALALALLVGAVALHRSVDAALTGGAGFRSQGADGPHPVSDAGRLPRRRFPRSIPDPRKSWSLGSRQGRGGQRRIRASPHGWEHPGASGSERAPVERRSRHLPRSGVDGVRRGAHG